MAQFRWDELKEGLTLEDLNWNCIGLYHLLSKSDADKLKKQFDEYHGDYPNYEEMPWYKFIYENVVVGLKG